MSGSHGNTPTRSKEEQARLDAIAAAQIKRDEQEANIIRLAKKLREM